MSTNALTVFEDEEGKEICVLYTHWDGYPDGHGKALREFIVDKPLVNGFVPGKPCFNTMNDLVTQVVAHLKMNKETGEPEVGNQYLFPPGSRDHGEEWIYTVKPSPDGKHVTVTHEEL